MDPRLKGLEKVEAALNAKWFNEASADELDEWFGELFTKCGDPKLSKEWLVMAESMQSFLLRAYAQWQLKNLRAWLRDHMSKPTTVPE